MEDFIKGLNLPFKGEMKGSEYVISLENSDQFSKLYDTISLNIDLTLDGESTTTDKMAKFMFNNDDYEITLLANFDQDVYKCTIGKR